MKEQYMLFNNRCAVCGKLEGAHITWRWAVNRNPVYPFEIRGHIVWAFHCQCGIVTEYTDNPTIVNIFDEARNDKSTETQD